MADSTSISVRKRFRLCIVQLARPRRRPHTEDVMALSSPRRLFSGPPTLPGSGALRARLGL
jgi:hypothetical protein